MLTCGAWLRVFQGLRLGRFVRLVLVYRHPLDVANSLIRRGNIDTVSRGFALWFSYNSQALSCVTDSQVPCLVVSFERVFSQPGPVRRSLSRFIGTEIDKATYDSFVEPGLVHAGLTDTEAPGAVAGDQPAVNLLRRLKRLEQQSLPQDGWD